MAMQVEVEDTPGHRIPVDEVTPGAKRPASFPGSTASPRARASRTSRCDRGYASECGVCHGGDAETTCHEGNVIECRPTKGCTVAAPGTACARPGRPVAEDGGNEMAKGQVKKARTNKPKLSPKEKKANKAAKQAAKAKE